MEKATLIKKWLDNNLNPEEVEEFKALEDYDDLIKISEGLEKFKAPETHSNEMLNTILSQKKETIIPVFKLVKTFGKIAAVFLICFGVYYFSINKNTSIKTVLAEKTITNLPDASTVHLNAASSISFNKNNWSHKRFIELKGEAFFKVAKGSKFDVVTDLGTVSVLGTQFNVKNRESNLEVICYEGLVSVTFKDKTVKLNPGDSFKSGVLNKKMIMDEKPFWINNESDFKSEPFINVVKEFERQYGVTVQLKAINKDKLFTGRFIHNDIDVALKSITLPFNIKYLKKGKEIILTIEN